MTVFDRRDSLEFPGRDTSTLAPRLLPSVDLLAVGTAFEEKRIISPTLINLARASFVRPQEVGGVFTNTPPLKFYGAGGPDGRVGPSACAGDGRSAGVCSASRSRPAAVTF